MECRYSGGPQCGPRHQVEKPKKNIEGRLNEKLSQLTVFIIKQLWRCDQISKKKKILSLTFVTN